MGLVVQMYDASLNPRSSELNVLYGLGPCLMSLINSYIHFIYIFGTHFHHLITQIIKNHWLNCFDSILKKYKHGLYESPLWIEGTWTFQHIINKIRHQPGLISSYLSFHQRIFVFNWLVSRLLHISATPHATHIPCSIE